MQSRISLRSSIDASPPRFPSGHIVVHARRTCSIRRRARSIARVLSSLRVSREASRPAARTRRRRARRCRLRRANGSSSSDERIGTFWNSCWRVTTGWASSPATSTRCCRRNAVPRWCEDRERFDIVKPECSTGSTKTALAFVRPVPAGTGHEPPRFAMAQSVGRRATTPSPEPRCAGPVHLFFRTRQRVDLVQLRSSIGDDEERPSGWNARSLSCSPRARSRGDRPLSVAM